MSSKRTVAVIGATGTVGSRIVRRLVDLGVGVQAASRSGPVFFDWSDESTYAPLVSGASAVYVLPPVEAASPAPSMRRLVEVALDAGVTRLVLHSATVVEPSSPGIGEIHALVAEQAPEWAVLRPSWFMQNLLPGHYLGDEIAAHDRIPTSVEDGRITYVDAGDIAAVAVHALVDEQPFQSDLLVTGSAAVSYDEIAETLSVVAGRHIVHDRVSTAEVERLMLAAGMAPDFVPFLAGLENRLRHDSESTVSDVVERVTGRPGRSLREFGEANAEVWRR